MVVLASAIAIVLLAGAYVSLEQDADAHRQALELEYAKVSPPDGALLHRMWSDSKLGSATVGASFDSQIPSSSVVEHYQKLLLESGWHPAPEETRGTGTLLCYRKGDDFASVATNASGFEFALGWGGAHCL